MQRWSQTVWPERVSFLGERRWEWLPLPALSALPVSPSPLLSPRRAWCLPCFQVSARHRPVCTSHSPTRILGTGKFLRLRTVHTARPIFMKSRDMAAHKRKCPVRVGTAAAPTIVECSMVAGRGMQVRRRRRRAVACVLVSRRPDPPASETQSTSNIAIIWPGRDDVSRAL